MRLKVCQQVCHTRLSIGLPSRVEREGDGVFGCRIAYSATWAVNLAMTLTLAVRIAEHATS
jgi:hypothetical protein